MKRSLPSKGRTLFGSSLDGALRSGVVDPGTFVTGFVVLAAPASDNQLQVICDDFDRPLATWELYDGAAVSRPPIPTGAVSREFSGWRVTLLRWEQQSPEGLSFFPPTPGPAVRLIAAVVRFDNEKPKADFFAVDNFEVQDSAGVRRHSAFIAFDGARGDRLGRGRLVPGGHVVGSIIFQVPKDDTRLQLVYTGRNLEHATWDLR